ncbi:hypothetical protein BDV95DRAFT_609790 [Massariosphaeria phaeospora]|uniref:J domain-containing protein n=1 Tax=Massariosphaeria phaeospora TaxID=100035 RepID=A0A7C8MAL6_9PLEO|nr:hypothetical protein BDV95DRAFT_609790 [Massariosphaeria phaeospora]
MLLIHPDKLIGFGKKVQDARATYAQRVNGAHDILRNPRLRSIYDTMLRAKALTFHGTSPQTSCYFPMQYNKGWARPQWWHGHGISPDCDDEKTSNQKAPKNPAVVVSSNDEAYKDVPRSKPTPHRRSPRHRKAPSVASASSYEGPTSEHRKTSKSAARIARRNEHTTEIPPFTSTLRAPRNASDRSRPCYNRNTFKGSITTDTFRYTRSVMHLQGLGQRVSGSESQRNHVVVGVVTRMADRLNDTVPEYIVVTSAPPRGNVPKMRVYVMQKRGDDIHVYDYFLSSFSRMLQKVTAELLRVLKNTDELPEDEDAGEDEKIRYFRWYGVYRAETKAMLLVNSRVTSLMHGSTLVIPYREDKLHLSLTSKIDCSSTSVLMRMRRGISEGERAVSVSVPVDEDQEKASMKRRRTSREDEHQEKANIKRR